MCIRDRAKVGPRFGKDPAWIVAQAESVLREHGVNWVNLAMGMSLEEHQAMRAAQETGDESLSHVEFNRQLSRVYPLGADGLQVLGMLLGNDDESPDAPLSVGSHGIEAQYRAVLDGMPGRAGGLAGGLANGFRPARPGMDLRLDVYKRQAEVLLGGRKGVAWSVKDGYNGSCGEHCGDLWSPRRLRHLPGRNAATRWDR